MNISIIIPAFNEEKIITQSLTKLVTYLTKNSLSAEIIVIDDGSTDATYSLCKTFKQSQKYPITIKVLRNSSNKGKGYSIKKGMLHVTYDVILFMDADLSTSLLSISLFQKKVQSGFDIVIASRNKQGAIVEPTQSLLRQTMGTLFAKIVNLLVLPTIEDTQCGFKMFTKSFAKNILNESIINGFSFDVELLCIAKQHNRKILEIPVHWKNNKDSSLQLCRDPLIMFFEVLKIMKNHSK